MGRYALPVYEIYKAGHDLHWEEGLDLLRPFGLSLVVVPHWNNNDGGVELDTSRCFMGEARFSQLRKLLPDDVCIVGLDEHTGLLIDVGQGEGRVLGQGRVTVLMGSAETWFGDGEAFSLDRLGPFRTADLLATLPDAVQVEAVAALEVVDAAAVPDAVLALADERQDARTRRDWAAADRIRNKIEGLGWRVEDTAVGPRVVPGSIRR
jgi:hypothetical protein